jgi:hypothetical protein
MGYSIDDWFKEKALPVFTKAFQNMKEKDFDEFNGSEYDIFMQALQEILDNEDFSTRKEQFERELFFAVLKDKKELIEALKTCFENLTSDDDKQLLVVEYQSGSDKVRCDFRVFDKEED